MQVAVVGLGGVGGYFGGKLALAYAGSPDHRVCFVARGPHLAAIREGGLKVEAVEGAFTAVPALAADRADALEPCDLVFLAVKEYDLEAAAVGLAPLLGEGTVVLPVLNGVDVADRLRTLLPRGIVLPGCVYISAFIAAPGLVRQIGGGCQLLFGPEDGQIEPWRRLERLFQEARIKVSLVSDIAVHLWTKYLFVSPLAGVTSLRGRTFGEVMGDPADRAMVLALMGEIVGLARAQGVPLPEDGIAGAVARAEAFPPQSRSSLQLDHARGGRSELDLFIGYAVRAGRILGVPVPVHEALYAALCRGEGRVATPC